MANGVSTLNRSFKYHRPRGVMSAGVEEANALLTVCGDNGELPAVRTTVRPLREGLKITSPNGFPSVDFDLGRVLDYTHGLWAAGFYNKTSWPGLGACLQARTATATSTTTCIAT
jgi:sarcosine oxidase subunit alpha